MIFKAVPSPLFYLAVPIHFLANSHFLTCEKREYNPI
jgi:hypothetical protein